MHTLHRTTHIAAPETIHLVDIPENQSDLAHVQGNQPRGISSPEEVEPTNMASSWGIGYTTPLLMFSMQILGMYSDIYALPKTSLLIW